MSEGKVEIPKIGLDAPCETMPKILDLLHYYNIANTPQIDSHNSEVCKVVLKHCVENTTIEISEFKNTRMGKMEATVDVIYKPPAYLARQCTSYTTGHKFESGDDLIEALSKAGVEVDRALKHTDPVFRPAYKTRFAASFTQDLKCLDSRIDRLM
jgi:hypothetical protein